MRSPWLLAAVMGAGLVDLTLALSIPYEHVFHDDDLFSFVTMPDVRAPRFDVTIKDPHRVTPGYWFIAPYTSADPVQVTEDYKPHQVGPCIYDGDGELVWTGAHLFKDRSVFDFRATQVNGQVSLSFIVNYDPRTVNEESGAAMVLDSSFQPFHNFPLPVGSFNMHEFNVVDDGKSALLVFSKLTLASHTPNGPKRKVIDNGFLEIDMATGEKLFEWSALAHMNAWDSQSVPPHRSSDIAWDFAHINSVDKSKVNGDYIVSARYTDAIYRISGADGSIVWQLGGDNGSFTLMDDFMFLAQHDARIIEESPSILLLSFLNNGADDTRRLHPSSSGVLAELNTDTMTARLLENYDRPDHQTTHGRGNIQVLPNRNVFANWADNSYMSEFTPDGDLVWEAQFHSRRYVNYRAYKFDFVGAPREPPQIVAQASVTADARVATVVHVSWNGATQVRRWNFYACADEDCVDPRLLGSAPRTGFETAYVARGLHRIVFAEAVGPDGAPLGESAVANLTVAELPGDDVDDAFGIEAMGGSVAPELLVLALVAMVITVFWVFSQRRRFKVPLRTSRRRYSEKQIYWDKD